MPSSSNSKRSQPIPAKKRQGGNGKTPRGSPNNTNEINAPVTTASHASKRVAKAVRSGKSGSSKSKTKKTVGDGPEAELSDDEEVVYPTNGDGDDDGETTPEPEERAKTEGERVVEGISGKSVPKNEISMGTLIAGAKPRPESHNISRGYEIIPSPASRLIIPADRIIAHRLARHDSIASSTGFTEDSDWEKVQFELDGVDAFSDCESLSLSQRDLGRKKAYADVVKRTYALPIATASAA